MKPSKMSRSHLSQGKPFALPNEIFDRLYGYQREGVAWMAQLLSRQHGGVAGSASNVGYWPSFWSCQHVPKLATFETHKDEMS